MKIFFTLLLLIFLPISHANELVNHHSPYLKLHQDDPVNWRLLDPKLLTEAKQNNKLLFISSGYYSCHWCHVMQKESYKNKHVANFLNQHFISIKIDRELEPALDSYLIDFVSKTRGSAGWPLNVFITPEGHPLLGLTYLPQKDFLKLLIDLQKKWSTKSVRLKQIAKAGVEEDNQYTTVTPQNKQQIQQAFLQQTLSFMDDFEGGFGNLTKFPMAPNLEVVMQIAFETNNQALQEFVKLTLNKMAHSGLRDPLNGGFFRYTIDQGWKTPHFEKMLYDNAQLAKLYLLAHQRFPKQGYQAIAHDTLDYVIKNMSHPNGGYISSLTANDSLQVEGGFYLWTKDELKANLNKDEYPFIKNFWSWITLEEIGEHLFYPIQKTSIAQHTAKNSHFGRPLAIDQLTSIKTKLINYQQKNRINPKDDKRLTSWNALFLEALYLSSATRHKIKAKQLENWMALNLFYNKQLYHHANHQQMAASLANLEDYAYLAKALLNSQKTTINVSNLLTTAWQLFYKQGFWHASQHTFLPGEVGYYEKEDNALPSAEATIIVATKRYLKNNSQNLALAKLVKQTQLIQTQTRQKQAFSFATYLLK